MLNSAHTSLNTGLVLHISLSFRWLFPYFCRVCHRFAPSLRISDTWPTGFCAEDLLHAYPFYIWPFPKPFSLWPFPKPWFTHTYFGLNLNKPWFEQNQCFCVKTVFTTKSCFTQKPCSCWACARAVCGLQDSSFHGGGWNTPKAVKYYQLLSIMLMCLCENAYNSQYNVYNIMYIIYMPPIMFIM